jgi:hypothetical protein
LDAAAMNLAITYSSAPRKAALPWLRLLLLLCATVLLSGCKNYGPIGTHEFDPTYSLTLEKNEQLLFSAWTELVDGTFMEGEEESHPSSEGVLLLTKERILFAIWNDKQQRYEPSLWADYTDIAQIKMHNNILLQYIAIVATDGSKFTFMLGTKSVDPAYAILMEHIQDGHKVPMPAV